MLTRLVRRQLDAFGREYNYDVSYTRDILEAGLGTVPVLWGINLMAKYCRDVPRDTWFAAKMTAIRVADCGPCLQLGATMAERAGVDARVIRAILAGDEKAMGADAALGFRFAHATLRREPAADSLRQEIMARWGRRALVSLAFGIAVAAVFPTLKTAMGRGQACSRFVRVAGQDAPVLRERAVA